MKINTSGICLYCQCKQRENEMTVHKNTIHYYAIICHARTNTLMQTAGLESLFTQTH